MSRVSLSVAFLLLALPARAFGEPAFGEPAFEPFSLQCFDDGTLVNETSRLGLSTWKGGRWQALSPDGGILRLWRSPDDRIFAIDKGDKSFVIEVPHGARPQTRWKLPSDSGWLRFTSLDGPDVVTPDRIYRLDPGGKVTDLGETPAGAYGQRSPSRAPEILVSPQATVVCTGTWMHHDDSVGGSCRDGKGAYAYEVSFGEPLCCTGGEASFATPFICGDVVVSAIRQWPPATTRNRTQARSLATGRLIGRRDGAALRGSTCIDGKRALLVGKRGIQIVGVPSLRQLWREKHDSAIGAVAVCHRGTRAMIVPMGNPVGVEELDLTGPAMFGKEKSPTTNAGRSVSPGP